MLTPTRLPVGAFRRFVCTKLPESGHSRTKSIHTLASQAYVVPGFEPVSTGMDRTLAHIYRSTWSSSCIEAEPRLLVLYRIVLEPLPMVCGH